MVKKSDHIRIMPKDKILWRDYCKALNTTSPNLFSRVIHSPEIKLNDRILKEKQKIDEDLKRRLSYYVKKR